MLLGASDASRRAAVQAAASIAYFDENQDLALLDDQIEFAQRAAELVAQQGAARLLQDFPSPSLIEVPNALAVASGHVAGRACLVRGALVDGAAALFASSCEDCALLRSLSKGKKSQIWCRGLGHRMRLCVTQSGWAVYTDTMNEPSPSAMTEHVYADRPQDAWGRLSERMEGQQWPTHALYVVATPIGNLGDLSLRAWHALSRADVIAAEDTRASRNLLEAWGINTPLMAAHRHNEFSAATEIVERIQSGQRVALISDAGSPAVSDPGGLVVQAVRQAGLRVIPLPGASALITALMSAGVTTDASPGFVFAGFAPTKSAARQRWFRQWTQLPAATVFYEAPHRIVASATDAMAVVGPTRKVTFARELTKRFEEIATMPIEQAAQWLAADPHREQGEYVVIIHPPVVEQSEALALEVNASVDAWLDVLLESMSVRDVARVAAKATGQPRDALYTRALALKANREET